MSVGMLEERWTSFCRRTGVYSDDSKAAYNQIVTSYSEQHRAYHTLSHIADCLDVFDDVRNQFEHPDAAEMAIWMHDICYDIFAEDNELKSAKKAYVLSQRLGFEEDLCELVYLFISSTDHLTVPKDTDTKWMVDIELILDIDLSIFGKQPKEYDVCEDYIKKEYVTLGGIPEEKFKSGRIQILKEFLNRQTIYRTDVFGTIYEEQARLNIKSTIEILRR